MCNAAQGAPALLNFALLATKNLNPQNADANSAAPSAYLSGLEALDHSQAQARLNTQKNIAEATGRREKLQREAAQESGKKRTKYGASGLSLNSGSILELIADQAAKTQAESKEISRQSAEYAAGQRLDEEHYANKKMQLYNQYEAARQSSKRSSLLSGYNNWRSGLNALQIF